MGLNGSLLRSLTMALLLAICCGKRRCNYKEIRDSYRNIILVQLQSLNLTSSLNISKKDHCPSEKAHQIVRSIYSTIQQFRCNGGKKPEKDLEKPIKSMELLLTFHCGENLIKKVCPARTRGKKRRRLRLLNLIKALVHCWQKLQSILSQTLLKD